MSVRTLLLASLLCLGAFTLPNSARAEDEPAEGSAAARLLEKGLDGLRLRMQAAIKEADLLASQGRIEEALLKYRDAARIYDEGFAQIRDMVEATQDTAGPVAGSGLAGRAGTGPMGPVDSLASPTSATEAVARGLRWLATHQSPSGAFEADGFSRWADGQPAKEPVPGVGKSLYTIGTTGLSVLAFLGAGHSHQDRGPYSETVGRALRFLLASQDSEGCVGPRATQQYIYLHAIAGLAIVEAYGMTRDARLKAPAQRALDFAAVTRNPYFAWRYGVKPGDNDTSVTAWMTALLASGRAINASETAKNRAPEFAIDEAAFAGALAWIEKVTDPDYGRVGYVTRGTGPARPQELVDRFPGERSESMTAAALVTRVLCGQNVQDPAWQKGLGLLRKLPPRWAEVDGSIDMYYWYYGTLACFQAGGAAWREWSAALTGALLPNQRHDGTPASVLGSFDPVGPWGPDGGRVYSTALMTIALEVVARYDAAAARIGVR